MRPPPPPPHLLMLLTPLPPPPTSWLRILHKLLYNGLITLPVTLPGKESKNFANYKFLLSFHRNKRLWKHNFLAEVTIYAYVSFLKLWIVWVVSTDINNLWPRLHETRTKSNRDRFGHGIIYNRCLHGNGTKITQTGLKSFRLLDRTYWLQTGMNSDWDECKHRNISDRSRL